MRVSVLCAVLLLLLASAARAGEEPRFGGKTAAEWTAALSSEDVSTRQRAVWGLFQLAPGCTDAAVPLARAVGDADDYVRSTATSALMKLGAGAKPAMPVLAGLLESMSPEVRRAAVQAIYQLGPLAAEIVPALQAALASPDAQVRANAAAALGNAGPAAKGAAEALTALLDDEDADVVKWAARARVAVDLPSAFSHPSKVVRLEAVRAYSELGSRWDGPILEALVARLGDEDEEIRGAAGYALGNAAISLTPYPADLVGPTHDALAARLAKDPAASVRRWAAYALAYLGRGGGDELAHTVAGELLAASKSPDAEVRRDCLRDLGWLGKRAGPEAVARFLEALGDTDPTIRATAAIGLGGAGDASPEVIGALRVALEDPVADGRRAAATALAAFGEKAAPAAGDLAATLRSSKRASVQIAIAKALAAIGPAAKDARPALVAAAKESPRPDFDYALARIDPAPARIATLAAWVDDEDEVTVAAALAYLETFGTDALPVLPQVVKSLSHRYQDARMNALRVLAAIGPAAASAIPEVKKRLDDPNPNVRAAAEDALKALDAK